MRSEKSNASSSALAAGKNGLDIMQELFGLFDGSLQGMASYSDGPVLIAIDIENMTTNRLCKRANCQFGVAIYDPKQPFRMTNT
jgi:hypothetical protein